MKRIAMAVVLSVAAAGCSGGGDDGVGSDPLEGVYQVATETQNTTGCATEGAAITPAVPFFQLKMASFFGTPVLGFHECTDASNCEEDLDLFGSFVDEGSGWMRKITASSEGGGMCALTLIEGPITATATGAVIDTRNYQGDVTLNAGEVCEPELAEARRAELTCGERTVTTATKL